MCKLSAPLFLKKLDMFGADVPTINMRGQTKIKTTFGTIVSLSIFILVLAFAIVKL